MIALPGLWAVANRFATNGSSPVLYFTPNIYTQRPQSKENKSVVVIILVQRKSNDREDAKGLVAPTRPCEFNPSRATFTLGRGQYRLASGRSRAQVTGNAPSRTRYACRFVSVFVRHAVTGGGTKGGQIRGASRRTFRSEKLYCGRLMVSELVSRCGRTTDEGGCSCRCCVGKCGDSGVS